MLGAPKTVITAVLLICFLCPVLELFDQWDDTLQTGNDTEYALVIVGLCVGVAYALTRFALTPIAKAIPAIISRFCAATTFIHSGRNFFFIVPVSLSPPIVALRI